MTASTNRVADYPCENCDHDSAKHTRRDSKRHIVNACTECECESYRKSLPGGRVKARPVDPGEKHLPTKGKAGARK